MTSSPWPRVLMVDSERSWRGGQEQVRLLMRGLIEGGAAVTLAAPADGALFERAAALGIGRVDWRARASGLRVLRRALAAGAFDVVHSHASRAHGAVALARVGLAARPPHVVSRRVASAIRGGWKYRRGAEAFIAISQHVRSMLITAGVPAARIAVIADGIDPDRFAGGRGAEAVRAELGLGAGTRVVGSVAALTPEKGHADLLNAAARIVAARDDVRFLVVGEGSERSRLERLAAELGIAGRVVFTGFRVDALDLLRACDVLVMASHMEGLGTSIMDAQAVGVPVVATRVGGIPEIVDDGASGLLVPPRSPQSLAAAVRRVLEDGELRARCIGGGRERARGYDYRNMVYKTLDFYRGLPEQKTSPDKGR